MSSHLPGYEAGRTLSPREVLLSAEGAIVVPIALDGVNGTDGANANVPFEIRAGWLLGQISASGLWVPCKRTRTTGAGGTGTAITVINAAAFKVGEAIDVGNDTNQTIAAVNYGTNTITLAGSITWAASEAVVARDGTQTCRGILLDFVRLRNDDNSAPANKSASMLIQGAVKASMVLGDLAAVRADTAAKLAGIRFSDEHGQ